MSTSERLSWTSKTQDWRSHRMMVQKITWVSVSWWEIYKCLSSKLLEDCFFLYFIYQKTELVSCFKELLDMLNISGQDLHIFLSPCIYIHQLSLEVVFPSCSFLHVMNSTKTAKPDMKITAMGQFVLLLMASCTHVVICSSNGRA